MGTVRLGRGDTVTVPQAAIADDLVAAIQASESTFQPLPAAGDLATPVGHAEGATTGQIVRSADQVPASGVDEQAPAGMQPGDDLTRQVHELLRQIEEQNASLIELQQAVATGQQQWHSEREGLRNQLIQQAFHIDRLQADLANANILLAEIRLQNETEAARPHSHGEKASAVRDDPAALSNTRTEANSASLSAAEVRRPISSGESPGLQRQTEVATVDRPVTERESENAQNVATTIVTPLDDGLPDVADGDAAQRETIGSVESVLSTVVWHALRANAAEATLETSGSPARIQSHDEIPRPSIGPDNGRHARTEDERSQVLSVVVRKAQRNGSSWRMHLIGSLVALIASLLAAAYVAGSWIWNR